MSSRRISGKKKKGDGQLHPLVIAHLEGEGTLLEKLRAVPDPKHPAVTAMLELRKSLIDERRVKTAFETAEAVVPKETPPDLYHMLLCLWAYVSYSTGNPVQAQALLGRAESLVDGLACARLRAAHLSSKSMLHEYLGEVTERNRLLREAV